MTAFTASDSVVLAFAEDAGIVTIGSSMVEGKFAFVLFLVERLRPPAISYSVLFRPNFPLMLLNMRSW